MGKTIDKKTLTLTLKRKWFEMIASGEKKEEYREIKPFWTKRLTPFAQYDAVTFTLGYPPADDMSRRMTFRIKDIHIGYGKKEWGAESTTQYYVITLGERLK